jgi:hypothetical protein
MSKIKTYCNTPDKRTLITSLQAINLLPPTSVLKSPLFPSDYWHALFWRPVLPYISKNALPLDTKVTDKVRCRELYVEGGGCSETDRATGTHRI